MSEQMINYFYTPPDPRPFWTVYASNETTMNVGTYYSEEEMEKAHKDYERQGFSVEVRGPYTYGDPGEGILTHTGQQD